MNIPAKCGGAHYSTFCPSRSTIGTHTAALSNGYSMGAPRALAFVAAYRCPALLRRRWRGGRRSARPQHRKQQGQCRRVLRWREQRVAPPSSPPSRRWKDWGSWGGGPSASFHKKVAELPNRVALPGYLPNALMGAPRHPPTKAGSKLRRSTLFRETDSTWSRRRSLTSVVYLFMIHYSPADSLDSNRSGSDLLCTLRCTEVVLHVSTLIVPIAGGGEDCLWSISPPILFRSILTFVGRESILMDHGYMSSHIKSCNTF
eukprot:COSAG02_NODE_29_length_51136_cov_346.293317_17_plen_259_part_00